MTTDTDIINTTKHYWMFCSSCNTDVVICGTCGNNCCNGGNGTIIKGGVEIECPDCDSAYDYYYRGIDAIY